MFPAPRHYYSLFVCPFALKLHESLFYKELDLSQCFPNYENYPGQPSVHHLIAKLPKSHIQLSACDNKKTNKFEQQRTINREQIYLSGNTLPRISLTGIYTVDFNGV